MSSSGFLPCHTVSKAYSEASSTSPSVWGAPLRPTSFKITPLSKSPTLRFPTVHSLPHQHVSILTFLCLSPSLESIPPLSRLSYSPIFHFHNLFYSQLCTCNTTPTIINWNFPSTRYVLAWTMCLNNCAVVLFASTPEGYSKSFICARALIGFTQVKSTQNPRKQTPTPP